MVDHKRALQAFVQLISKQLPVGQCLCQSTAHARFRVKLTKCFHTNTLFSFILQQLLHHDNTQQCTAACTFCHTLGCSSFPLKASTLHNGLGCQGCSCMIAASFCIAIIHPEAGKAQIEHPEAGNTQKPGSRECQLCRIITGNPLSVQQ